ncbi:MAG: SPFH domain-containing protein, partial [Stackebrandtia sp.]
MDPLVATITGACLLVVLVVWMVLSRIKVAGPNEAFVVTGRKGRRTVSADGVTTTDLSGQKVVMGAAVFVMPVTRRLYRVDLSSRRIMVRVTGVPSSQGIRVNMESIAIVKVGGTTESVRAAAQRFLNQESEISGFTEQALAGTARAVLGRLTVDQLIADRSAVASNIADEAESSLTHQGLMLDSFHIE